MKKIIILKQRKNDRHGLCQQWGVWGWLWRGLAFLLACVALILAFCLPIRIPVLHTGDVQITLRWETDDDLDLHCISPSGDCIFWQAPRSSDGGRLDVDANGVGRTMRHPVENIYWRHGSAPGGTYSIYVSLYTYCSGAQEIPFKVAVKVDGQTQHFESVIPNPQDIDQDPIWTYTIIKQRL